MAEQSDSPTAKHRLAPVFKSKIPRPKLEKFRLSATVDPAVLQRCDEVAVKDGYISYSSAIESLLLIGVTVAEGNGGAREVVKNLHKFSGPPPGVGV